MQCLITCNARVCVFCMCFVCIFLVKCKFRTLGVQVQGSRSVCISIRESMKPRRARDHMPFMHDDVPRACDHALGMWSRAPRHIWCLYIGLIFRFDVVFY